MSKYTLNRILKQLRKELNLTAVKAREIGSRLELLRRETRELR